MMWVRGRSFGQRQEGWWSDNRPPGEVERNVHRSLWNPLLLPWRAPKAPPSLHRGRTFQQQLGSGEQFLRGCISPGVSEEMPSHLCSSATSPQQHLAFYSQLRNPLAPLLFSLNLELELTGRHNFLCTTLCCLPDVLLHVNIHSSEGNIALIKSWKSSSPVYCSQQGQHWVAQGLVRPKYPRTEIPQSLWVMPQCCTSIRWKNLIKNLC